MPLRKHRMVTRSCSEEVGMVFWLKKALCLHKMFVHLAQITCSLWKWMYICRRHGHLFALYGHLPTFCYGVSGLLCFNPVWKQTLSSTQLMEDLLTSSLHTGWKGLTHLVVDQMLLWEFAYLYVCMSAHERGCVYLFGGSYQQMTCEPTGSVIVSPLVLCRRTGGLMTMPPQGSCCQDQPLLIIKMGENESALVWAGRYQKRLQKALWYYRIFLKVCFINVSHFCKHTKAWTKKWDEIGRVDFLNMN